MKNRLPLFEELSNTDLDVVLNEWDPLNSMTNDGDIMAFFEDQSVVNIFVKYDGRYLYPEESSYLMRYNATRTKDWMQQLNATDQLLIELFYTKEHFDAFPALAHSFAGKETAIRRAFVDNYCIITKKLADYNKQYVPALMSILTAGDDRQEYVMTFNSLLKTHGWIAQEMSPEQKAKVFSPVMRIPSLTTMKRMWAAMMVPSSFAPKLADAWEAYNTRDPKRDIIVEWLRTK